LRGKFLKIILFVYKEDNHFLLGKILLKILIPPKNPPITKKTSPITFKSLFQKSPLSQETPSITFASPS